MVFVIDTMHGFNASLFICVSGCKPDERPRVFECLRLAFAECGYGVRYMTWKKSEKLKEVNFEIYIWLQYSHVLLQ